MCIGGISTFLGFANEEFLTLYFAGTKFSRFGQSFTVNYFSVARLSHKHIKRQHFVYPVCSQIKNPIILRSHVPAKSVFESD